MFNCIEGGVLWMTFNPPWWYVCIMFCFRLGPRSSGCTTTRDVLFFWPKRACWYCMATERKVGAKYYSPALVAVRTYSTETWSSSPCWRGVVECEGERRYGSVGSTERKGTYCNCSHAERKWMGIYYEELLEHHVYQCDPIYIIALSPSCIFSEWNKTMLVDFSGWILSLAHQSDLLSPFCCCIRLICVTRSFTPAAFFDFVSVSILEISPYCRWGFHLICIITEWCERQCHDGKFLRRSE